MTLMQFFETYKSNIAYHAKRLILCEWKSQEGYEVTNEAEFETLLHTLKDELYLMNAQETDDLLLFDYFTIAKTEPYVVIMQHPLMTNAYWKDLPDKILDIFVCNNIYRYISVEYNRGMREYIIELPTEIDESIIEYSRMVFPRAFKHLNGETHVSVLFTNNNRFKELDPNNFVIYKLEELYPQWDIKKITPLNASRKYWAEIKQIGSEVLSA